MCSSDLGRRQDHLPRANLKDKRPSERGHLREFADPGDIKTDAVFDVRHCEPPSQFTPRAQFGRLQNLSHVRSCAQKLNAGSDGYGRDGGAGFQGGAGVIKWQTTDLSQQAGNRAPLSWTFYGAQSLADLIAERKWGVFLKLVGHGTS